MTDALINGVALGWNPRKTARAMNAALQNTVLNRALLIARTEQLRAHRMATQENYQQNGVTQYMRVASKSGRTCIACLVADGTIYEVDHIFDAHPNCRCTMIPHIAGREIPRFTKGRDWLESQSPAVQQRIMGKAAHAAWKDGAITLDDMVARHEHPVWGGSLQKRSLRSILGDDEAQRWIDEARGVNRQAQTGQAVQPAMAITAADARAKILKISDDNQAKLASIEQQINELDQRMFRAGLTERQEIRETRSKVLAERERIVQSMRDVLYL